MALEPRWGVDSEVPGASVKFHFDYVRSQVSHYHLCLPAFQIPPKEDCLGDFNVQDSPPVFPTRSSVALDLGFSPSVCFSLRPFLNHYLKISTLMAGLS